MNDAAISELNAIYAESGRLHPEAIVERAKSPDSALHPYFQWDDGEAAHQFRLHQARQLIRVAVRVIPSVNTGPVRAYVSISTLRHTQTGSYLATVDALADADTKRQMLEDALVTLRGLQRRFAHLPDLLPVWDALSDAIAKVERRMERDRSGDPENRRLFS